MQDTTIIIKAFKRPTELRQLINSITRRYRYRIVVIDDSPEPLLSKKFVEQKGQQLIYKHFTEILGLSKGRNIGLQFVETDTFVLCDDDFLFNSKTNLELLQQIQSTEKWDILCGQVFDYPLSLLQILRYGASYAIALRPRKVRDLIKKERQGEKRHFFGHFTVVDNTLLAIPAAIHPHSTTKVDYGINFFIANTDRIKNTLMGWDEELLMGEHEDFFFRAKKLQVKVGATNRVSISHFPLSHTKNKDRVLLEKNCKPHLLKKHNLNAFARIKPNGGEIVTLNDEDQQGASKL